MEISRKTAIKHRIASLQSEARNEMIRQNMSSSLTRCYAAADRMYEQIAELDEELRKLEEN